MSTLTVDAVAVGDGHHGLVAAAVLADAGWDVCVLESTEALGGAIRSAELHPGYVADLFSAFYPLSAASPVLRALELERHGLRWAHAPSVLAHPARPDGSPAAVLYRDRERTAAGLAEHDARDGAAWLRLCAVGPGRAGVPPHDLHHLPTDPRTGSAAAPHRHPDALRFLRFLTLPARRMAEELFASEAARLLLAGNAVHADAPTDATVSGVFGWLLAMLGQQYGFPTPIGGTGQLAAALARRGASAGADIRTGQHVERIDVRGGRAVAVHTAAGLTVRVRRAVVADVSAPMLYCNLLPADALPSRLHGDLARFVWDTAVVKVNWALDGPVPWCSPGVAGAGTVHVGADVAGLARWSADIESRSLPASPFMLLGQMTTADATRSPAGTERVWAYTHLPRGISDDDELAGRMDDVLETFAPGFGARVLHRSVQRPVDLQTANPNLLHGAVNGGTAQLFQQLLIRPTIGLGRPETAIERLYLASASAHPGGGVHGVCGWLAAKAALADQGRLGPLRRRITTAALDLVYRDPV